MLDESITHLLFSYCVNRLIGMIAFKHLVAEIHACHEPLIIVVMCVGNVEQFFPFTLYLPLHWLLFHHFCVCGFLVS